MQRHGRNQIAFREQFGAERVGLMTGDLTVNREARIVVMTTEIFRNMLYAEADQGDDPLEDVSFVPYFEDITVEYEPGSTQEVTMHDGSKLYLRKLEESYDPTDRITAMKRLQEVARRGEFATGLIYIEPDKDDFLTQLNMVDAPLASLPLAQTRPGPEVLEDIMDSLR